MSPKTRGLSLEHLESRLLLAAVNPNEIAVLFGGDQLYFIQGESDEDDDPASDLGGDLNEDWIIIVSFEGPGYVELYDAQGNNFLPTLVGDPVLGDWGGKIGDIVLHDTTEDSNLFIQVGEFSGDYGLGDWDPGVLDLSDITQLLLDDGRYEWGVTGTTTPFMDYYTQGGSRVNVYAPDGSGPAVVTGDIYFDSGATGFGTLAIDGSIKGSVGVDTIGYGLDTDETIKEIRVGFVNGPQSDFQGYTVGGLDIGGNVDRFIVKTTVAEHEDTEVNDDLSADLYGPAEVYVGGHLIEFQASGTIWANIYVGGDSTTSPVFDADYRGWTGLSNNVSPFYDLGSGEFYEIGFSAGYLNDGPDSSFIVGSPTGEFAIEGNVNWTFVAPLDPTDKWDEQDWYAFNPGLDQEITVDMEYGFACFTWVYAPSGDLVAVATPDNPVTFTAQEGGNYYISVGRMENVDRLVTAAFGTDYRVSVTGANPVVLGGVRAGSDIFNASDFSPILEFGDDYGWSTIFVDGNTGSLEAANAGMWGYVDFYSTGDLGYVAANTSEWGIIAPSSFYVGGDLGRLEVRDITQGFIYNVIDVGGNLGEVDIAGTLGLNTSPIGGVLSVGGHAGSIVTGGSFYTQLTVESEGLDLFYAGGDFGSPIVHSRVDMGVGADVAFAYVAGTIYYNGFAVPGVDVVGESLVFADDGGSILTITPKSTRQTVKDAFGNNLTGDPAFSYRYLPVGLSGGGSVGSVLTEIITNDALSVTISSGSADLPYIIYDPTYTIQPVPLLVAADFSLTLSSKDPLGELDVYFVDAQVGGASGTGIIGSIKNTTFQGDVVNVFAASVGRIEARGHVGLTEQYAPEVNLLNPTSSAFGPHTLLGVDASIVTQDLVFQLDPTLEHVFAGSDLYYATLDGANYGGYTLNVDGDPLRYWNGVAVSGNIGRIEAGGSVGNVYAGGTINRLEADEDGTANGSRFSFGGSVIAARTWDGLAGTVYAGLGIGYIDPGDGILGFRDSYSSMGGRGGTPVGGVFTSGVLGTVAASNSLIEGPIFALGGINEIKGTNVVLHEASIGAGATFSDWAMWDGSRLTFQGARLENLELKGSGSVIHSTIFQVGAIGELEMGKGTNGMIASHIWAVGDPTTGEAIGRIYIRGGNLDGTDSPPYEGLGNYADPAYLLDIVSQGAIGSIRVTGGDIINLDVMSMGSIGEIVTTGDIISTVDTIINAPLFIGEIEADSFVTTGVLTIGTGRLTSLHADGDFQANLTIDGPVNSMIVDGWFVGSVSIVGANGSLDYMRVGQGLMGAVTTGNYIGKIEVRNGDLVADIQAGGSTPANLAIGEISVRNGDLIGDVTTVANLATQRPGGGIGAIEVRGEVDGDITATGYYDASRGTFVTANIGEISVRDGDLNGDVTTQKNDPMSILDPGGNLGVLYVRNGNLNGDVTVVGDVGELTVKNGSLNGDVTVTGSDVDEIVVSANGSPAIDGDIFIEGSLAYMKVTGGTVAGSLTVGDALGKLYSTGAILQPVEAGYIGQLDLRAGTGSGGTITSWTDLVRLDSRADLSGDISVVGSVGSLKIRGADLDAELTVGGDLDLLEIKGGRVSTNSDALDPRIDVAGDVQRIKIYRYGGGGAILDDEVYVGDELLRFEVRDGDFAGTLEAGTMGTVIYNTPGGVMAEIVSHGSLDLLQVRSGPIDAPITVEYHVGKIDARGGVTDNGDMAIGNGFPGSGLDVLSVRGGNMEGELVVDGGVLQVSVRGSLNDSQIAVAGSLGELEVRGDVIDTDIVVGMALSTFYAKGNYTDTNINANSLAEVTVKGTVSSAALPTDEIHANTGSFLLRADGMSYLIDDAAGVWINDVHAYAG